jgi:hypothetical protein
VDDVEDAWRIKMTWANHIGDTWHALVGCKGATWPNHGLPRGTPVLSIGLCQKFLESGGFEPRPPSGSTPS